ncbi:MAG: hypothetical protein Q9225_002282 [Loekoesia sp. 1 TL-2023]
MDLPNELILLALGNLSTKDLKSTRLVCKRWAPLGLELLNIDTVYLSPREKNMEVFDGITQHPIISKSIKHLVYDSAQFIKLPLRQYYAALGNQFEAVIKHRNNPVVQNQFEGYTDYDELPYWVRMHRVMGEQRVEDGLRHYWNLAQEQNNLFSNLWFARARQGLEAIGTLEAVTVRCTWDMIFVAKAMYHRDLESGMERNDAICTDLFMGGDDENSDDAEEKSIIGPEKDDEEKFNDLEGNIPLIPSVRDQEYQGKSPVARSWPISRLLPMAPIDPWINPTIANLRKEWVSDGCFEVLKLIQLLKSAHQQPSKLVLSGGWHDHKGIPPIVLNLEKWPGSMQLHAVCQKLQVLDIKLASCVVEPDFTRDIFPCLDGLQSLFRTTSALRRLSLELPLDRDIDTQTDTGDEKYYNYSQVFPPVTDWCLPTLNTLSLSGLSTSYRNVVGLLWLNLPNLKDLQCSYIQLTDGNWEDLVEGLRCTDTVEVCQIEKPLLYAPNRFYFPGDDNDFWESKMHFRFLSAVSSYITDGGRHPSLAVGEPDSQSARYMVKLNATLDELRKARK